jgi:hypothetical protein
METKITILTSHRLLVHMLHFFTERKDAQSEFLLAASILKQMEIQFNSIWQENDKQFIRLSKKIDRKYHADAVSYPGAIKSALQGGTSVLLYFSVLPGTSPYFSVLLHTSWYFSVLLGTSSYFSVLLWSLWSIQGGIGALLDLKLL